MRELNVFLFDNLVGLLQQNEHGLVTFRYADEWLSNPKSRPLSISLPLRETPFRPKECMGFFGGVLPEEKQRKGIAQYLGISENNDFAMLDEIGGECAGAVSFRSKDLAGEKSQESYQLLNDEQLEDLLSRLPTSPLLIDRDDIRLSLAGAQDKIAVHYDNGAVSLPLYGSPSTHILKPAIDRFEGTVENEAFCMRLAAAVGIKTARIETKSAKSKKFLLVERYDRNIEEDGTIQRLHQEDFCQALGVQSLKKYEVEGGPGLRDIFALVRDYSTVPIKDLQHLLDAVIFNLLIGNNDAHGKNFSLLYSEGSIRVAPLYDILCTEIYPELSKRMAMRIGREGRSNEIYPSDFERLASATGLSARLAKLRVTELAADVLNQLDKIPTESFSNKVSGYIRERTSLIQSRFR